ncbi:FtsB family cell division protein [Allisonella histaminiformans]|uniref:FtsB family cell division protein n=1 Tax=Allisonella histaminiformans TaxID=209880 RepID=UPI00307F7134
MSIAIVILLFILILAPRVYQVYELNEQITQAELRKEQLVKEKQELDMKKKELNDSRVIEDKARHELGLVKPSEVPYVP